VAARRYLVHVIDENGSALFEFAHDVDVVNDLLADIHRGSVVVQRPLDRDDSPVYARAIPAWAREQHLLDTVDRSVLEWTTLRSGSCQVDAQGTVRDRGHVGDSTDPACTSPGDDDPHHTSRREPVNSTGFIPASVPH
jgi:hypothetical protein